MTVSAETIARQLNKYQRTGSGWLACCPAHADSKPSLSISDSDDGKVLVKCHAGCSQDVVIQTLKDRGAWPTSKYDEEHLPRKKIEKTYGYTDENGELRYQVVRYAPKDFRQRRPNGNGEWEWSLKGTPRVPYRLPDICASADAPIFVVEGEKDADALASRGFVASCNAGGAKNWSKELNPYFAGRTVFIIQDNDEPGRKHAQAVAAGLNGVAASVRVVDLTKDMPALPEKGDISDWLERGGDVSKLIEFCQRFNEWKPKVALDGDEAPARSDLPIAEPFVLGDPSKIPPREFIYGRHFIRDFVTATAGVGGSGKSTIIITEALSIATGEELLGEKVSESCRVWYANLEDPKDEIDRRVTAVALHHGITPNQLNGRLFISTGRSSSFVVAEDTSSGVEIVEAVVDALKAEIKAKDIGLLIIDPFVKVHRVSENANERIDAVITTFADIAEETGVCIELVPHLRKGTGERNSDDIRGASSLVGAIRSTRIVNVMTKEDGQKAGIEDDHRLYLRVDDGKRNMAPPADKTIWRKIVSVDLENATENRPSDYVGVATEWSWPNPFDGVTKKHLQEVQLGVAEGAYKASVQADNWVGKLVAEVLELDLEEEAEKAKVKAILKTWLQTGALKKVQKEDESRKERPFIEVGEWAR